MTRLSKREIERRIEDLEEDVRARASVASGATDEERALLGEVHAAARRLADDGVSVDAEGLVDEDSLIAAAEYRLETGVESFADALVAVHRDGDP
jgi:hypothetical protein